MAQSLFQVAAAEIQHYGDLLRLRKPSEVDGPGRDRKDWEHKLVLMLVLLVAAMPILLWCSRGEPLLLVWRLSLLLTAYFFLCANVLFVTKALFAVVVDFSYGALLAYFAHNVFGPRIGMVLVHLNSVLAAGMAGLALAERRRSDGTERAADNVPVFSDKEEEYASNFVIFSALMISLVLTVPTVYIAWVFLFHLADYTVDGIIGDLSYVIMSYLFFWTIFLTHHLLRGALINEDNHFYTFLITGSAVAASPLLVSIIFDSNVAATVVLWLGVELLTVFFGYCLAVYSFYKHKRSQLIVSTPDKLDEQNNVESLQELAESKDAPVDQHTSSPSSISTSPPLIHLKTAYPSNGSATRNLLLPISVH
ncbi:uncharacterized protein LOC102708488 [Oryza brachyantha]|uniref:uncharacterized protein LOC102708488 n=1 Tax=Oryza brachyantha TaxID=4533 RepID=UPI001AD9F3AE|nr:uncharacterized protein LOC102708488 [Oryza brachyantha]